MISLEQKRKEAEIRERQFDELVLEMANNIVNTQMLWQMDTPLLWHEFKQSLEELFMHFMQRQEIRDFKVEVYEESKLALVNFVQHRMLIEKELCIDFSNDDIKISLAQRLPGYLSISG